MPGMSPASSLNGWEEALFESFQKRQPSANILPFQNGGFGDGAKAFAAAGAAKAGAGPGQEAGATEAGAAASKQMFSMPPMLGRSTPFSSSWSSVGSIVLGSSPSVGSMNAGTSPGLPPRVQRLGSGHSGGSGSFSSEGAAVGGAGGGPWGAQFGPVGGSFRAAAGGAAVVTAGEVCEAVTEGEEGEDGSDGVDDALSVSCASCSRSASEGGASAAPSPSAASRSASSSVPPTTASTPSLDAPASTPAPAPGPAAVGGLSRALAADALIRSTSQGALIVAGGSPTVAGGSPTAVGSGPRLDALSAEVQSSSAVSSMTAMHSPAASAVREHLHSNGGAHAAVEQAASPTVGLVAKVAGAAGWDAAEEEQEEEEEEEEEASEAPATPRPADPDVTGAGGGAGGGYATDGGYSPGPAGVYGAFEAEVPATMCVSSSSPVSLASLAVGEGVDGVGGAGEAGKGGADSDPFASALLGAPGKAHTCVRSGLDAGAPVAGEGVERGVGAAMHDASDPLSGAAVGGGMLAAGMAACESNSNATAAAVAEVAAEAVATGAAALDGPLSQVAAASQQQQGQQGQQQQEQQQEAALPPSFAAPLSIPRPNAAEIAAAAAAAVAAVDCAAAAVAAGTGLSVGSAGSFGSGAPPSLGGPVVASTSRVYPYQRSPVLYFRMGGGSGRRNQAGRLEHGGCWINAPSWPLPWQAVPQVLRLTGDRRLELPPGPSMVSDMGRVSRSGSLSRKSASAVAQTSAAPASAQRSAPKPAAAAAAVAPATNGAAADFAAANSAITGTSSTAGSGGRSSGSCDVSSLSFVHDPWDPVPTIGGNITSGEPIMSGGAFDQVCLVQIHTLRPCGALWTI